MLPAVNGASPVGETGGGDAVERAMPNTRRTKLVGELGGGKVEETGEVTMGCTPEKVSGRVVGTLGKLLHLSVLPSWPAKGGDIPRSTTGAVIGGWRSGVLESIGGDGLRDFAERSS